MNDGIPDLSEFKERSQVLLAILKGIQEDLFKDLDGLNLKLKGSTNTLAEDLTALKEISYIRGKLDLITVLIKML
jgi:hypothetical protein